MTKKECINYMITCEGYRSFFIEKLNNNDITAIETEFGYILDELCKNGDITSEQYRNYKCPSIRTLKTLLKVKRVMVYV